jgi:outer membrane protein assembly factor BamA
VGQFSAVQVLRRIYLTQSGISATYPLSTTRRFEFGVGATRYGFGVQVRELGRLQGQDISVEEFNEFLGDATNGQLQIPSERDTRYLANATVAYVRDFTSSALTGPIRGGRWRVGVTPNVGSKNFVNVRADLRRYFYAKPFTFALQALHVGNYGAGSFDRQFGIGNEYIGYPYSQGFVRGYNVREIDTGRRGGTCTPVEGNDPDVSPCAETERLFGTRALTTRAEIRVPFLGPDRIALVPFKYLPTTLSVFADAGITWDGDAPPIFNEFARGPSAETTIPVTSAGAAARFNVLGRLVLEMYYARPFQRTDTTWEWGLRISPGW